MPIPSNGGKRRDVELLEDRFEASILKVKEYRGETFVCVDREKIAQIALFLRDEPELEYRYFVECLGADYSAWKHDRDLPHRFEVIYNLFSLKHNARLFLKVGVDDGQSVPTLINVFLGAEYPEREIADLYGLCFEGNKCTPEGQRFLLPDDWVGFPLRKEVPLGGDEVIFDGGGRGPAVEDISRPHAGESFEGKTGTQEISRN